MNQIRIESVMQQVNILNDIPFAVDNPILSAGGNN